MKTPVWDCLAKDVPSRWPDGEPLRKAKDAHLGASASYLGWGLMSWRRYSSFSMVK